MAGIDYSQPVLSIVTGGLGSGGGLTTTPLGDYVAMLDNAEAWVAEPTSATSILYNTPSPTPEQVRQTTLQMRSTAKDQLELKLIDEVIETDEDKIQTAKNIRHAITKAYLELQPMSEARLKRRRNRRIEKLQGIPIVK